jgi:hypothetical protein
MGEIVVIEIHVTSTPLFRVFHIIMNIQVIGNYSHTAAKYEHSEITGDNI